jgi:branched-chain amino acid transport system substrate-binding protein
LSPRRWFLVLCAVVLTSAACGSRLSSGEIRAQSAVAGGGSSEDAGIAAGGDEDGAGTSVETGDTGDAGGADGAGSARAGERASAANGRTSVAGGAKAPLVIGLVGSFSGIAGPPSRPVADAWVAWSKAVNAKGGINGHPVRLLIGDDGTNASRTVSLAREFVESKGAIALSFHGPDPSGFAAYALSKRVPVVGTTIGAPVWNENPMLFPTTGGIGAASWGQVKAAKDAGASKMAVVFCAESPVCKAGADRVAAEAKAVGVEITNRTQISLGAPDYTAECLQIRNSGAQAVSLATENGSALRLAASCGRQGFHPIYTTSAADDRMAKSKDFEGAIAVNQASSWFFRGGNPAIDEYVAALQKYVPKRLDDGNSLQASAWSSAKLFEAAAARAGDEPTSQDILDGLYALRGETLGGLAPGGLARTFNRGQPTPDTFCVFVGRVKGGRWTGSLTPICR